jgi:putative transcriptional regulator
MAAFDRREMVKGSEVMDKRLFAELKKSVSEMDEIVRGEREPSRELIVDAVRVKQIRAATGLSQAKFARLIDVQVTTLRNWEQGRREPTGPAKALLRAIQNDPRHVLEALAGQTAATPRRGRARDEART